MVRALVSEVEFAAVPFPSGVESELSLASVVSFSGSVELSAVSFGSVGLSLFVVFVGAGVGSVVVFPVVFSVELMGAGAVEFAFVSFIEFELSSCAVSLIGDESVTLFGVVFSWEVRLVVDSFPDEFITLFDVEFP
ncbi:MAG: hypothetical protein QMD78_05330 [Methanocellales archaeon]|nr:hypothetical protein [Methanocellales archaeon]